MRWRYRHTVLVLCTLAFFVTMVARLSISPVVPAITDEFEITNSVIGVALTGMWMAYSLSQFPSGVLADRFGERPVILLAVAGTAVATLLIALAPVFGVFVLATIALGALAGLHYSVATTLLTRTYDDIGTAIGLHSSGAPAAGLLTPVIVTALAGWYDWRAGVAIGAVFALPVFVLFAWWIRPTEPRRPEQPMTERFEPTAVRELLARPSIAFTVCLAVMASFVWQGVASFLPAFLVEYRGQSTTLAGIVFSGYFVVQGVAQVGVGAISDRYGRDRVTAVCMVFAVAGLGLLVAGPGLLAVALAILCLGTGLSWGAALLPRFMDNLGDAERGAGFGLVRSVYGVLGALGSVGTGLVADLFGWAVAFGVLIVLLSIVFGALLANGFGRWGY